VFCHLSNWVGSKNVLNSIEIKIYTSISLRRISLVHQIQFLSPTALVDNNGKGLNLEKTGHFLQVWTLGIPKIQ